MQPLPVPKHAFNFNVYIVVLSVQPLGGRAEMGGNGSLKCGLCELQPGLGSCFLFSLCGDGSKIPPCFYSSCQCSWALPAMIVCILKL